MNEADLVAHFRSAVAKMAVPPKMETANIAEVALRILVRYASAVYGFEYTLLKRTGSTMQIAWMEVNQSGGLHRCEMICTSKGIGHIVKSYLGVATAADLGFPPVGPPVLE